MRNSISLKNSLIVFGIPLLMILILVATVKSSFFVPKMANLVVVDFLITIPLVYFLLIRKREIANKTTLSVAFLGLLIAGFILPKENQELLSSLKIFLIPLMEVLLVGYIVFAGRRAFKKVKEENDKSLDFYDVMYQVCNSIFPFKIGSIVAVEISMIYFGLFNWKKKVLRENEFSYHKNGTAVSVILGFLLVVFVEMFVTHSMIKSGNMRTSIILGALSGYSALQVISILRSLPKRPIFIDLEKQNLVLKFGILAKAIIPFKNIKSVELTTKEFDEKSPIKYFSPLGSGGGHNIILELNEPIRYEVFYGFTRKAQKLAVFVDEKNEFVTTLNKQLEEA